MRSGADAVAGTLKVALNVVLDSSKNVTIVLEAPDGIGGYGIMSMGAGEAHILNICVRADLRDTPAFLRTGRPEEARAAAEEAVSAGVAWHVPAAPPAALSGARTHVPAPPRAPGRSPR